MECIRGRVRNLQPHLGRIQNISLPSLRNVISAISAATLAVLYQLWLKDVLFITLGVGRHVQRIESFPYKCRRIQNKQLEGCGDMWLDEKGRVLYAACTGSNARRNWNPSLSKLNSSRRRPQGSELMAIYIDEPRKEGGFRMHRIQPTLYGSESGASHLDLLGFDTEAVDSSTLRFWLINQRPPYDAKGKLLNAREYGANSTVEVYEYRKRDKKMKHVKTVADRAIYSPANIALMGADNFVISNDRSSKVGFRKKLDPLLGGGNLVYCNDFDRICKIATTAKLRIPGGLLRGKDDRVYVPSGADGGIHVFELQESDIFKHAHVVKMGMPIHNLGLDSKEDLWAVGSSEYDPTGKKAKNTIFRVERFLERRYRYVTTKIIEDAERKFFRGATVARHDVKTKRIFVGGLETPFISMCEPKS
ncbi:serum paraoxonase/arylesteras-like protein [Zopfia rhizophila CBS 207.26]|uniref:Serum paraoxonase/arylesteras-like protein n=1 Tax=Zopfia rhizophila CBS 207.26 TaxID=1314779 RepID=A0A6A6E8E7_9PEZI|nr:serum paraoxonase/arylesteras-like protein [Zopfia rhizophila CBS 207.26]